jgi:non-ribosomal peptide synthase protein (TIGR01720 family)
VDSIPLTSNGKTDKRALALLTDEKQVNDKYVAPRNETELRLAGIWRELLNVDEVGIYDNFFELGGDSILTIQVVSRARKAGIELRPKDVFSHQTVADLSDAVQRKNDIAVQAEEGWLSGSSGLTPIQQWYLDRNEQQISHYNQSLLFKIDKSITAGKLQQCFDVLLAHHDALRFRFTKKDKQWCQEYTDERIVVASEKLSSEALIYSCAKKYQESLSIARARLVGAVIMETPDRELTNRLFIVVHHLAVDGVSWRIIVDHLNSLLDRIATAAPLLLGKKGSSYRQWHSALTDYSRSKKLSAQESYWLKTVDGYQPFPVDNNSLDGKITMRDMLSASTKLDREKTRTLVNEIPQVYHTEINDLLLAALSSTLCNWVQKNEVVIGLEGHGREPIAEDVDVSQTVGWFTSMYPVLLTNNKNQDLLIKETKEGLRKVPDKGVGFGVLKYVSKVPALQGEDPWDLIFNYLGQLDNTVHTGRWLSKADEDTGSSVNPDQSSPVKLSVTGYILGGELVMQWSYSSKHYVAATITDLAENYNRNLSVLINYCLEKGKSAAVYTPADYGLSAEISYRELDKFLGEDDNDNILSF